jgi:hypothetical protein
MFRAASFNSTVHVLRSQQHIGGGAGIELKPASSNMLLGQTHLEGRGKFVAAHPVRRGASPSNQPLAM